MLFKEIFYNFVPMKVKPSHLLSAILVLAAVVCSGCGSARHARRNQQPDVALQGLNAPTTEANVDKSHNATTVSEAPLSPLAVLQNQLTALTQDSIARFSQLGLRVVDLTDGIVLFSCGEAQRMRPASSEKLVTAIAALHHLGPNYRLTTSLASTADIVDGTLRGDLYVRGAMDPLLTAADVRALATKLRDSGVRTVRGRIVADATLKDKDDYGWGWCWDDDNPVLSPMLVGGKPALSTALQNALRGAGVRVTVPVVVNGQTPTSARVLAAVSRPLTDVLQPMLKQSDNLCAEAVFYQLGPTRDVVATRINSLLDSIGCDVSGSNVADGSGLSLYNYQTANTFTTLLTFAASRPDSIFNPLLQAMPIASVDGTLKRRMADTPAANNVRAKTGSVTAISTLVGYTTQRSTGHLIAFAILNQGLHNMAEGRQLQDKICAVLSQ